MVSSYVDQSSSYKQVKLSQLTHLQNIKIFYFLLKMYNILFSYSCAEVIQSVLKSRLVSAFKGPRLEAAKRGVL